MITFKELNLPAQIQAALDALGYTNPTDIQQKAIPVLMSAPKIDVLGQAQTGTGKTFAFGIPLLTKIKTENRQVQALIVAPTRELVLQIRDSLRQITKHMNNISIEAIYGGVSMFEQIKALKQGVHIVIGTPGRLNDHLRRRTLSFDRLHTLVLDEADTMLDMGFKEEVDELLENMPDERQIWLFSATIKPGIQSLMRSHMKDPVSLIVTKKEVTSSTTKQFVCAVSRQHRLDALCRFVDVSPSFYGFVFCPTKTLTAEVAESLNKRGYAAYALHGDMNQAQRNIVIKKFKNKEFDILVATDVAARGIDVSQATHVINYSLPNDQESYVHRIGRTGRAGNEGTAITFISPSEVRQLRALARKFNFEIQPIEVPNVTAIAKIQQDKALASLDAAAKQAMIQDSFVEPLMAQVSQYSKESLAHIVVNSLYTKFLSTIPRKELDIKLFNPMGGNESDSAGFVELFLSVGADDGITKGNILNYIHDAGIAKDDIKKIKILRKHTFAVIPEAIAQKTVQSLADKPLKGKRIRVNITNETPDLSDRGSRNHHRRKSNDYGPRKRMGGFSRQRSGNGQSSYARY